MGDYLSDGYQFLDMVIGQPYKVSGHGHPGHKTVNPISIWMWPTIYRRSTLWAYDHHMMDYLDVGDQWIPIPGQGHNSQPYKLSGHGHPYNLDGQPYDLLDWCG